MRGLHLFRPSPAMAVAFVALLVEAGAQTTLGDDAEVQAYVICASP
jgi:hypothetical protein